MCLLAEKMCPRRSVARAGGQVKGSVFNDFLLTGPKKFQKKERVTFCSTQEGFISPFTQSGSSERNGSDRAHGKQSSKRKRRHKFSKNLLHISAEIQLKTRNINKINRS